MTPVATGRFPIRRIPVEEARRRLGPTALHVLRMFWRWRDPKTGLATVTLRVLARSTFDFARVSWRQARTAVARLAEAGLVENVGWRPLRLASGRVTMVYTRRVYGGDATRAELGGRPAILVPEPVYRWISGRDVEAVRGGGQGRGGGKPGNRNWAADGSKTGQERRQRRARLALEAELEQVRKGRPAVESDLSKLEREDRAERLRARRKEREMAETAGRPSADLGDDGSGRPQTMEAAALSPYVDPGPPSSSLREEEGAPAAAGADSIRVAPSALGRKVDEAGIQIGGGTTPRRGAPVAGLGAKIPGLPRFPTLRSVTVPNPPCIAEEASDEEAAHALAKAYRGAFESATGDRCWGARPETVVKSRSWSMLLEAGAILRDAEIPPAGWVAWSFDLWRSMGRGKKPPALAWVFALKRVGEGIGWYGSEGYDSIGGTIVAGPREKSLFRRYALLVAAVDREGATDDATEVVARYFPEGFAQAVRDVEAEIATTRAGLRARLAAGDWLWS